MDYRRIAWLRLSALAVALFVLASTGVIGVYDAFLDWHGAHTLIQKSVTLATGVYGIFGVIASLGLLMRKRWSVPVATAWGVLVIYSGTVAVTVYSDGRTPASAIAGAFVGCLALASLVVWLTIVGLRKIVQDQ